ncbi:MAG: radical SAM protein, partial [Candidatus Aenigmatarchaeota archaeon]
VKFMENCNDVGLLVNGCFILGLPNDTKDSMRRTIEFAKKLNPDTAQFYPLMAYPGTEAYEWAKENDKIESEDFSTFIREEGGHHTNVKGPEGMSSDELVEWCARAEKEFYLRKEYIWMKFKQSITSYREAKRTLISAKTFFKHLWNG